MDTLKEQVMQFRNTKLATWKSYATNIRQLSDGITQKEYINNDFLNDISGVSAWIESGKHSQSKSRLLYAVILIMLEPNRSKSKLIEQSGEKNIYLDYQKKLKTLTLEYNKNQIEQKKTSKQDENWASWKVLSSIVKNMRKVFVKNKKEYMEGDISKEHRLFLQDWLIISLYTLIAPRRLDYADMMIMNRKDYNKLTTDEKEKHNFLVVVGKNKKFFSFGKQVQKNKNLDRNGIQQSVYLLRLPPKLNSVMNIYLKYGNPEEKFADNINMRTLLYNIRGKQLSKNGLSQAVMRITKSWIKKKISPTLIRTIFISNTQKDDTKLKLKLDLAEQMGHTTQVAEKFYAKKETV